MKRWLVLLVVLSTLLAHPVLAEDGQAALPPFPNVSLQPLDGGTPVTLDAFHGHPVLLSFWASWCGPCREELPQLQKLHGELKERGLVLATVNVDQDPRSAHRFLEATELEVPVYRLSRRDLAEIGVRSLPTLILIGPGGKPVDVFQGYSTAVERTLRKEIDDLLRAAEQPAAGDGAGE